MLPSHPHKLLIRVTLGALVLAAVSAFAPQPRARLAHAPGPSGRATAWPGCCRSPAACPKDGSVIGWRFGVSPDGAGTDSPREVPAFDDVCGKQAADVRPEAGRPGGRLRRRRGRRLPRRHPAAEHR